MTTFNILFLIIIQLVVPPLVIFSLWKGAFKSKLDWLVQVLFIGMFIIWVFFSGPWDWVGYYFRYVWLILFILAIYPSWKRTSALPFRITFKKSQLFSMGINSLLMLLFAMYNIFILSSYTTNDDAIELSFPLKDGTYYVGQGGNHPLMNYHNAYPDQKYALDIEKLNKFGFRANGIYPKELDKYVIYGDTLYSPCNAEVLEARNHLPDQAPPESDPGKALGNYVALMCENEDSIVYMAHMQEGSASVEQGVFIQVGEKIGSIGNSGNTTEPHLHIHAEQDGKGVPITFDGKFLVRNNLVKEKHK